MPDELQFSDLVDLEAAALETRAFLQQEVQKYLGTLNLDDPATCPDPGMLQAIKEVGLQLTLDAEGEPVFGTPEQLLAARALEFGSTTRQVRQIRLLSRLREHLEKKIAEDFEGAIR